MKTKYIIPFFIALLFVGCDLDREPQDKIFSDSFWKTENDVTRALMGCYAHIPASVYNAYLDGYADNSYCQYPWESKATVISAGDITDNEDFGYGFVGLRRFNYFLENVDKAPISETLKKQTKAEVRTLRAWFYFNLASRFGDVPLIKTYITETEEGQIAPTSEKEVINFVISELEQSIPDLPTNPSVKSRLGQAAAYAVKARVHLFYGQYPQVVEATQAIMGMGYDLFKIKSDLGSEQDDYSKFIDFTNDEHKQKFYSGLRSYEKLFWDENKGNVEVIFNQEFIEDSFNYISLYLLSSNAGGGWSSITPTVDLVNAYWKSDGTTFTPPSAEQRKANYNDGKYKPEYLDEFKNRDTRLYATILYPGAIWKANLGDDTFVWQNNGKASNTSKTGYNYRKMVDPNGEDIYRKVNDFPLIRYAEVLLMYAEAQNEVAGADATVYEALHKIRERVGMPDVAAGLSKEEMREVIRNERRIELACEGHRWNDIRRWGISSQVMKDIYSIHGELAQKRRWEDKFMRMPYPISAIDRNPKLKDAQKAKGY
ncbi:RagB/SusD family nutrient uptake outer membrane protein [Capnocytophaga stomatis]|uniref:RagB/SusD family nutrient uptake outer membrane protein n=1 Tax=Capnocytophaga stomatis TaxID=1848904 RepID=A0A250FXL6_9FLAO|nr:RagB/SusD family nutrient uptake outer membrane protein [Capnocytophaga stomatis]ATA89892.1 RagB/SusD family nutrient uptake outer membrane protein [Capnocytophaga stomatis]